MTKEEKKKEEEEKEMTCMREKGEDVKEYSLEWSDF